MATLLGDLAAVSRRVGQTASRREKIQALADALRALAAEEIETGLAFLSGELPGGRGGIGYALVRHALDGPRAAVASLTLMQTVHALAAVGATAGKGSAAARKQGLAALFARATAEEADFLARLILGELRQGALEGLMAEAVAVAAGLAPERVRRAAMVAGGVGRIAVAALTQGEAGLRDYAIQVMQPVLPMLAQPADDVAQAMAQLGTAALDWKVDGARVQAHKDGTQVRVFTRSLKDVTAAVPEVVDAMQALPAGDAIFDGEVIALHPDGSPQPFQETMRRFGRKLEVDSLRASLPLSVYFFDCLRLDGRDLTAAPAAQRFDALSQAVPPGLVVPRLVTADVAAAEAFYADALARGHEGIMAKSLTAPYEAGGRGAAWLKIKRVSTLDLVVLAAEWGNGRRRGWLSNLHLGAREGEDFVMLGKTFKGMTDALLAWQTQELLARAVRRDGHVVYVRPELVVEVAFDQFQASSQYPGGLALRFARIKGYRPDKSAGEADTMQTVRALHAGRSAVPV
jgi:DNA ligase-1